MNKVKIFCFGFGQVAEGFINKLIKEKIDLDLSITSRQESHQVNFNGLKFSSYQFDGEKIDNALKIKLSEANNILISIPPINGDDQVINILRTLLLIIKIANGLHIYLLQVFTEITKANG